MGSCPNFGWEDLRKTIFLLLSNNKIIKVQQNLTAASSTYFLLFWRCLVLKDNWYLSLQCALSFDCCVLYCIRYIFKLTMLEKLIRLLFTLQYRINWIRQRHWEREKITETEAVFTLKLYRNMNFGFKWVISFVIPLSPLGPIFPVWPTAPLSPVSPGTPGQEDIFEI